jgi:hypothetical protein
MESKSPIIAVFENGEVNIGPDYNIGQILEAIEVARRALLGVILRPADGPADGPV